MNVGEILSQRYVLLKELSRDEDRATLLCMDQANLGQPRLGMVLLKQESARRRRDFETLKGLTHPNLPTAITEFEGDGGNYLVVEHVQGVTLADWVATEGCRTETQTLDIGRALASLLNYLHAQQPPVVCANLGPRTIVRRKSGHICLVDCDLIRVGVDDPASAPEAAPGFKATVDVRGNHYALGATLYFLLTGEAPSAARPLDGTRELVAAIQQLMSDQPPSLLDGILGRAAGTAPILLSERTLPAPVATSEPTLPLAAAAKPDAEAAQAYLGSGTILNERFRVEKVLGEGGMGAVYLATHLELEQPVAIKEMRLPAYDAETRSGCVRQFKTEARILNRLRHPNLPRVYDFFQVDDHHYLVMDFIQGTTLEDAPSPEVDVALRWARELCDVLEYLHSQDPPVIFRDLKPANVMVCEDGGLRLIDFGIAKIFEKDTGISRKSDLQGFGSHGYAAPEQYVGGTDERVDVYALGATLYFALTGRIPPPSVERVAQPGRFVPLRQARPGVPEKLDQAVEWMMTLSRKQRPGSIGECRRALGLVPQDGLAEASGLQRVRQLLREEFTHFFPAPWLERGETMAVLSQAVSGGAPVIQLSGVSGVGKSRFIHELTRRLAPSMRVMPIIRGLKMTRHRPLGALLPSLQALVQEEGEPLLTALATRLDEVALGELSQILPGLPAPAAPSSLGALERSRVLLEALRTLVGVAASLYQARQAGGRLLWCIDDAHWLDHATIRLLDSVLERELPVTLLLAGVPDIKDDVAQEAVGRWKTRYRVVDLPLVPLTRAELTAYLQASLPPMAGGDKLADVLYTVTRGNPMHLEELVRWLIMRRFLEDDNGTLGVRPVKAEQLPATIADTVRGRAELLPDEARDLLASVAVIGRQFDAGAMTRLLGAAETPALTVACEAMFVRAMGDQGWEFVSDATREVFYGRLSAARRRELHMTMGRLEEESHENPLESDQAYHFEQAGDVTRAIEALSTLSKELLTPTTIEAIVREGPGSKKWADLTEVSTEQVERFTKAVSALGRSVKSMARYGPLSPIVQTSVDTTMWALIELQAELGPLLVSCSENHFALNGHDLDARQAPPELVTAFRRHRMSGFEVRPGMGGVELSRFLEMLTSSHDLVLKDGGWAQALVARQVTTIQVIESVLVEVSERDLFDPVKLRQAQQVILKEGRADGDSETGLVTNREVGSHLESIRGLLEQVKTSGVSAPQQLNATANENLDEAWGVLSQQAQREEILRLAALSRMVERPLLSYLDARPELVLPDIESPDRDRRCLAAMALLKAGASAVKDVLVNYLASSDSAQGRAVALFVLGRLLDNPAPLLIGRLVESFEEPEVVRLLNALRDGRMGWDGVLEILLLSSSEAVRRATSQFLVQADLDAAIKVEILRKSLKSESPIVVLDTLRAVAELRSPELAPDVGKLLAKAWGKSSPEVVRAQIRACHTLGRIGVAETVLPLLRPIVSKGIQATLLGGWDSEIRSAATWAIGRLQCDEGRELLSALLKDSDVAVRTAAQLALDTTTEQAVYPSFNDDLQAQIP